MKALWKNRDKYAFVLVLLFLIALPVAITPWVYSDGVGDYAWVRSAIIDGDLDCANEFVHFVDLFKKKYGWPDATDDLYPVRTRTGLQANKYPIGTALLWSPFFIMAHGVTKLLNNLGLWTYPADGYSAPYILFVAIGSAIYGFLGLFLAYFLAARIFDRRIAFWATVAIWFASSVPVYMFLYPSMPHNTALFTVSLFVFYLVVSKGQKSLARWALLGFLGGMMMLTRLESFVLLVLPLVEIVHEAVENRKWQVFAKNLRQLAVYGAAAFLVFLPQMLVWKHVFGRYLLNSYAEMQRLVVVEKAHKYGFVLANKTEHSSGLASFLQFASHPDLKATLLGSSYGIFLWTPILLLAVIGLYFLIKKQRFWGLISIIGLALLIYITSCSHKEGMSFGDRYLIKASPFFILGLAALLEVLFHKLHGGVVLVILVAFIIWNGLFIVQYATGLVNRQGPVDWKRMIKNQFTLAPKYFADHLGPFLTGRSNVYKGRNNAADSTQVGEPL